MSEPIKESIPIREDMVETAVKFLSNSKVKSSPLSYKKLFLKKKGLTPEEIDLAVEQSGANIEDDSVESHAAVGGVPSSQATHPPTIKPKTWKIRDITAVAVILSGGAYTAFMLFKKFILPKMNRKKEEIQRLENIENSVTQLNTTMQQTVGDVQRTISELQQCVSEQQEKLLELCNNVSFQRLSSSQSPAPASLGILDEQNVGEIKAEISSLKKLFLNRRQFPASPIIPSWQLSSPAAADDTSTGNTATATDDTTATAATTAPTTAASSTFSSAAIVDTSSSLPVEEQTEPEPDVTLSTTSNRWQEEGGERIEPGSQLNGADQLNASHSMEDDEETDKLEQTE